MPHSPPFGKILVCMSDDVTDGMLEKCASLFSEHYGTWGTLGPKPGQPVRLSASRLRQDYLFNDTCMLVMAYAKKSDQIVGHAFACRFRFQNAYAVWVTQLVVHRDFRSIGLATELLAKCLISKDNIAWGLVSSHPHAVRALERNTKRKCQPQQIARVATELIQASQIPYLRNCGIDIGTDPDRSLIHTHFYIDHTEANAQLEKQQEWRLGTLGEGDEFFAFTFE